MGSSVSDQDDDDAEPNSTELKFLWAAKNGFCNVVDKLLKDRVDLLEIR